MSADTNERTTVMTVDMTGKKSAESDREACLIIIQGTPHGRKYDLKKPQNFVGRDRQNVDILFYDNKASRRHARVDRVGDSHFTITDLGSTNGTYLNESKLESNQPRELKKEDQVRIGECILKFYPRGSLEIASYESATIDGLTQIYNKKFILEALQSEFGQAKASKQPLSACIWDIDHFKKVNDGIGHDAGDYILKEVVKKLQIRPSDIMGRYGGEEFLVIFPETKIEDAVTACERFRKLIEGTIFEYNGKPVPVTISVGVAQMSDLMPTHTDLFKAADKAVYQSKQGGRNRVSVFAG